MPASYHYTRDTDGCDETFDVYREGVFLLSLPYWDHETQAEALAKHLVAALNAHEQDCIAKNLPIYQPKC